MVSYFDHAAGTVPRPRVLLDKKTTDAHDNPTLALDRDGFLWIFSPSHGTSRPSYIHRSTRPRDINEFERVATTNFSYPQPWFLDEFGFLFLHTKYKSGRRILHVATSKDGRQWSTAAPLAAVEQGHYQISASDGKRVATAFNFHPKSGGLNARTNIYYLESNVGGQSWRDISGRMATTPIEAIDHACLVRDYRSEGLLVYLKDMGFDRNGRPVILYLTSQGYASGPKNDPRTWRIAHWTGDEWRIRDVTTSDHNYDFGSLYLEPDGTWRIIAPTDPGPQRYNPGGQVVVWTSSDEGRTWTKGKPLTNDDDVNHTYVRRPINAHPDFYALWADGDARQPSESRLHFTNKSGDHVWQLPSSMTQQQERPVVRW